MEAEVMTALAGLRPGTTMCPGDLARRLGKRQRDVRPVIARLAAEGKVRVTQRGESKELSSLRGPYRVAPA